MNVHLTNHDCIPDYFQPSCQYRQGMARQAVSSKAGRSILCRHSGSSVTVAETSREGVRDTIQSQSGAACLIKTRVMMARLNLLERSGATHPGLMREIAHQERETILCTTEAPALLRILSNDEHKSSCIRSLRLSYQRFYLSCIYRQHKVQNTQPFQLTALALPDAVLVGASIVVQNKSSKPLLGDPAVEELQAGLWLIKGHHVSTRIQSHVGEVTI